MALVSPEMLFGRNGWVAWYMERHAFCQKTTRSSIVAMSILDVKFGVVAMQLINRVTCMRGSLLIAIRYGRRTAAFSWMHCCPERWRTFSDGWFRVDGNILIPRLHALVYLSKSRFTLLCHSVHNREWRLQKNVDLYGFRVIPISNFVFFIF